VAPVTTTCPDCAATAVGGHVNHPLSCPLGIVNDARVAMPTPNGSGRTRGRGEYRRAPHWSEIAELVMWGACFPMSIGDVVGYVVVHQLALGMRTRCYDEVAIIFPAVPR
jgi:hypothetical protein